MALLALMLCSLVALSLIRARFSPIGNLTRFLFLLLLFTFYSFCFWEDRSMTMLCRPIAKSELIF